MDSAAISIAAYSLCSGSMLVVNKLVVFHIPAPAFVASIQIVACVCVLAVLHFSPSSVQVEYPTREIVFPYAVYSLLFALSIFTNIHALQHSNVETVIVFRSATPIAVAFCDTVLLGREHPSLLSFGGICMILAGAIGYVLVDSQFAMESFWAYQWVSSYYVITVAIMTYGKFITSDSVLSLSGSVAYSNALSLPVMLALMVLSDETSALKQIDFQLLLTTTAPWWLLASCVVGTGISYAGWWCRSQISATSFTIVGVVNKALTIGISSFIDWGTKTSLTGLLCLGVVIGGGLVYTQPPMRKPGDTITLCSPRDNWESKRTLMAAISAITAVMVLYGGLSIGAESAMLGQHAGATTTIVTAGDHHPPHRWWSWPPEEANDKPVSAAIVLLAPSQNRVDFGLRRVCLLKHSIQSIDQYLNSIFEPYPIFVVVSSDLEIQDGTTKNTGPPDGGELYTEADRASIRSWAPHSTVTFVDVPMYSGDALPNGFNLSQFARWNRGLDGGVAGRPVGYRSMCRLWSGRLQHMPFMQSFEYYMRLDDDSFFTGPLSFDPFVRMKEQHLQYAYRQRMVDHWGIDKLWELASPVMTTDKLRNMEEMGMLSSGAKYTGSQPYNNFHVASVRMWNTPEWLRFADLVERNFGFMKYRFGDANVHAIAMGMLLNPSEVAQWSDLPYAHNTNNLPGYPPSAWKEECETPDLVRLGFGT
eukprot:SAG31_NODE_1724_length_7442_cov_3.433533_1_plen_703_part_00